jgi:hypothetical protein
MANTEKVYTTKSSAQRALNKMEDKENFIVIGDDEYGWQIVENDETPEVDSEEYSEADNPTVDGFLPAPKKAKAKEPSEKRNGNCKKVWDMADSMPGAKRIEVVRACVAAGIPEGTTRTQYQHWFKAQKAA